MKGPMHIVLLSCGHNVLQHEDDAKGAERWCPYCPAYRPITEMAPVWRWTCRGCRAAHSYGAGKFAAQRGADAHQRAHRDHTVFVVCGDRVSEVRRGCDERGVIEPLPFPS